MPNFASALFSHCLFFFVFFFQIYHNIGKEESLVSVCATRKFKENRRSQRKMKEEGEREGRRAGPVGEDVFEKEVFAGRCGCAKLRKRSGTERAVARR